jgi:AcrR family transcriptional regulator
MILTIKNAIPKPDSNVTDRIVRRTLAKRESDYAAEVRRLIDAALELMGRGGTVSKPRVADIVAASGLSNDTFYRHFKSKDDLVAAILEDGAERLHRYLAHQMAKAALPENQVRQWVKGVLAQANPEIAATTLAVLFNSGTTGRGVAAGRHFASPPLASLLSQPFAELGSDAPELHAALVAHATLGVLSDYLWRHEVPTPIDIDQITAFCLRTATS